MYYVCLENNQVVSILNYQPSVPQSVTVVEISDVDYNNIQNQTHFFNTSTLTVDGLTTEQLSQNSITNENNQKREFLNSTDWKVLRHIREKAIGVETTMTEQEYLDLEAERQTVAKSILE
jgi:hypothetical protein